MMTSLESDETFQLELIEDDTKPLIAAAEEHTGAMIALIPSDADAKRLALKDFEAPEQLHLTLVYLGDAADIPDQARESIIAAARRYAAEPISAQAFAVNVFNPTGDEPALVLGVGNGGPGLEELRSNVYSSVRGIPGFPLADNHSPWVPHVTLAYSEHPGELLEEATKRTGPVTFDRIRVAFGGDNTDIPLEAPLSASFVAIGGDIMPWDVRKRGDKYCVVKTASGETVACHDSQGSAESQVKALYANTDYGLQLALQEFDLTFERERDVNTPGGGHNLKQYWTHGPGAAKIRWGTDGSFDRCTRHLGKYVRDPQGLCAEYHHAATGEWPRGGTVPSSVDVEELATDADTECPPGHHKMPGGDCMPDSEMSVTEPTVAAVTVKKRKKMTTYSDEPWSGVLAVEGVESGDGRLFALGSLDWAQLPLPLMYQPANIGGHQASVMVGEITNVARSANNINGWGVVFGEALNGEHGEGIKNMMRAGGVSVDVDKVKDADVEMIYADGETNANPFAKPETTIFHRGRIRGATQVAFPAFVEAKLSFDNDGILAADGRDCGCGDADPMVAAAHTIEIPDLPPMNWFDEPTDVKMTGALTITDEGRVYGILAPGGTHHRVMTSKTVPLGNVDYTRFHKGETIVAGGARVVTGVITADCGHAPIQNYGTLQNRIEHYDNSCSVLANVRIGESKKGYVWCAGALNAGAKPHQVAQALGCALSGDWQPHPDRPGMRDFISAHLVPVPGFPLARTQASVQYEDGALVASSVPVQYVAEAQPLTVEVDFNTVMHWKTALAASIGRDPATVKAELAASLREM